VRIFGAGNQGPDRIELAGFLKKMSSGSISRWQKRYFELSGFYLKYYTVRTFVPIVRADVLLCRMIQRKNARVLLIYAL
jgi:hypothetical protein